MEYRIEKGQVWSYKTRKGEEKSLLTILDIESLSDSKAIAHVEIHDIIIKDLTTGDILSRSISHMPFDLAVFLKKTLLDLKYNKEVGINEGYLYWKLQNEKGEAGIWSIEIAEAISIVTLPKNRTVLKGENS